MPFNHLNQFYCLQSILILIYSTCPRENESFVSATLYPVPLDVRRNTQTIPIAFEDDLISASCESNMSETTTLSKRNLGSRPAAVTRVVETKLPRCVQRRLPCAPVPVRCHPRPSPYRCVTDHRVVPKRPYRPLTVGLSATSKISRIISTPISKNGADRCPPGFLAVTSTPRCKKSLSMMDLSLSSADRDIGEIK